MAVRTLMPEMPELVVMFPIATAARDGSTAVIAGMAGGSTGACARGGGDGAVIAVVSTAAGRGAGASGMGEAGSSSPAAALTDPGADDIGSAARRWTGIVAGPDERRVRGSGARERAARGASSTTAGAGLVEAGGAGATAAVPF